MSFTSTPAQSAKTVRVTPEDGEDIQQRLDQLEPGDQLIFAPGIYRQSLVVRVSGKANHPITIAAESPGETILTGTDVIEDWSPHPEKEGVFTTRIDLSALTGPPKYGLLASRQEQVFINGSALRQVTHFDQLQGGTFAYDQGEGVLAICPHSFTGEQHSGATSMDAGAITGGGRKEVDRSDPENCWPFLINPFQPEKHRIEVTTRSGIFRFAGDHRNPEVAHVHLKGLIFRGSGDAPQKPMVWIAGNHLLIENCIFEAGAARGFDFRCHHSTIRRCLSRLNGQMGFSGYGSHDLIEDCTFAYNNTKHSDFVCFEQGGSKICRAHHWTVRNCRFIGNDGPGLWFDIDNHDVMIEKCWCEGNSGPGIMYEISSDAVIRNNVCLQNGFAYRKDERFNSIKNSVGHVEPVYGQGILVQMSRNITVHNNTCVNNRRCGIELRHHPYQQAGNPNHSTETYRLENNTVFNNVLVDNGWDNLMVSHPPANPSKTEEVRGNQHDFNLFHHTEALLQRGGDLAAYARWGKNLGAGSQSLEEWRAARHQDLHSLQWDPYFVSPAEKDFRLETQSPAASGGQPVKGFDEDFNGHPRNPQSPGMGAFISVANPLEII
ncbi:MAG: right-handed parallel beta-helix repeat-containing protein [Opitutales bacterium]|nr:right-handed parallel beta-helix repeat-containing protein [Opitutales bacterium]